MKKLVTIIIILCLNLTGCAAMKRHPLVTGAIVGVAGGLIAAGLTIHECEHYPPGESGVGVDCPKYPKGTVDPSKR